MMKTWLMRRPVRRPVSRATTAPSSSSVCRLPFISSSASPWRTSSTAFAAAAWLWGASTIRVLPSWMPAAFATSRIFAAGPTRIGTISPFWPASIAAASAVSSHGCATAVGTGSRLRQRSSSASYLPVPVMVHVPLRTRRRSRLIHQRLDASPDVGRPPAPRELHRVRLRRDAGGDRERDLPDLRQRRVERSPARDPSVERSPPACAPRRGTTRRAACARGRPSRRGRCRERRTRCCLARAGASCPRYVTGANGLPLAKIALPLLHAYACSAVHSAFDVGFDSAKITGRWLMRAHPLDHRLA